MSHYSQENREHDAEIISRDDFLKKVIRLCLVVLMSFLAFFLGSRVVTGKACTGCPGKGICNGGESDCKIFNPDNLGSNVNKDGAGKE